MNTFTGSAIANASGFINQRSNIYAVSGTLQWRISPEVTFSTWGGLVGTYASQNTPFFITPTTRQRIYSLANSISRFQPTNAAD